MVWGILWPLWRPSKKIFSNAARELLISSLCLRTIQALLIFYNIINTNSFFKVDSSLSTWTQLHNWEEDEVRDLIRDCFVTGNWSEGQDAEKLLALDDEEEEDVFGDFEDLETGEKHEAKDEKNESDGT